jgi:lysophospholipase L1-like esterase
MVVSLRWALLFALAGLVGCVSPPTEETPAPDPTPAEEEPAPTGQYLPPEYDTSPSERIVFLGDSVTAGSVAGGLNYRQLLVSNDDGQWPDRTGQDLSTAWPNLVEVVNESRGGSTSRIVADIQLPRLDLALGKAPGPGPTVSVMTVGGNDMQFALASYVTQGEEAAQERVDILLTNLGRIIDELTDPQRFPDGARVYLANVYEPTDAVGYYDGCFGGIDLVPMVGILEGANARIRALAVERGVAMIDLRGHFLGHGFYYDDEGNLAYDPDDPTPWFLDDCIHPNVRGHHEVRSLFWELLQPTPS